MSPALTSWATPAALPALHDRALRRWGRGVPATERARLRRCAAAAFHQSAVGFQRDLLLREILVSFEAEAGPGDPGNALLDATPNADPAAAAVLRYDVALAFQPDFAEARYNRAVLARDAGDRLEALAGFEAARTTALHPRARSHAFLHANASWESACLVAASGDRARAGALFAEAMARLDNYGVDHRALPDFLDASGRVTESAVEYGRLMTYAHRYPPQFVEPDFDDAERLPTGPDGAALDPLQPTVVARDGQLSAVYAMHLYFSVSAPADQDAGAVLRDALQRSGWSHAWSRLVPGRNGHVTGCAGRLGDLPGFSTD